MSGAIEMEDQGHHDEIRALAGEQYGSDEIEIDENAIVSEGDENGAFVAAWVWVDYNGTDLDKES